MSAEPVTCPHCGTNLDNSPAIAGQVVACPQCQGQLQMPAVATTEQRAVLPTPTKASAPMPKWLWWLLGIGCFSLVLIGIGIVILVSASILYFSDAQNKANLRVAKIQIIAITQLLEEYRIDVGS